MICIFLLIHAHIPDDVSKEQNLSNQSLDDSTFNETNPSCKASLEKTIQSPTNTSNEDIPILDIKHNTSSTKSLYCETRLTQQCVQSNFNNHDSICPPVLNQSSPLLKVSPDKLVLTPSKNIVTISSEEEDENIPCIDRIKPNRVSIKTYVLTCGFSSVWLDVGNNALYTVLTPLGLQTTHKKDRNLVLEAMFLVQKLTNMT